MADSTSTLNGPPTGGFYTAGDQVTDASGYVWRCTATGFAGRPGEGTALFNLIGLSDTTAGVKTGATVTMHDVASGLIHRTTLTFTATPLTIANGASEWVGTEIFTFPAKRILLLGGKASLAYTTTSVIATSTNGATGTVSAGSVTDDGTHTGTKVDFLPDTNFATSATINVAAAASALLLVASNPTYFPASQKIYLNTKCATNSIDATLLLNGTYTFTWLPEA